jgi:integrase
VETLSSFHIRASSNRARSFFSTPAYASLPSNSRNGGLPKLTFHVIRRTIATLAQKKRTIKDVQGVMRHSRTATATDVYMQEIPASVQSTINSINSELRKSDKKSRKNRMNRLQPEQSSGVGASLLRA